MMRVIEEERTKEERERESRGKNRTNSRMGDQGKRMRGRTKEERHEKKEAKEL